jgi:predicted HTH domain antitoxin
MNIVVPDDIMDETRLTKEELVLEIGVMLLRGYWISPASAARLTGMQEAEILQVLTNRRISTRYNADDVQRAIDEMRKTFW